MNRKKLAAVLVSLLASIGYSFTRLDVQAVDSETGQGMPGVTIRFDYRDVDGFADGSYVRITDSNGCCVVRGPDCEGRVDVEATCTGCYRTVTSIITTRNENPCKREVRLFSKDGSLTLKRGCVDFNDVDCSVTDADDFVVGFDFLAGDFTPPYGKGVIADVEFRTDSADRGVKALEKKHVKMLFPGAGNGATSVPALDDCFEVKVWKAPGTGYCQCLRCELPEESDLGLGGADRRFCFRIRTILNEDGEVKSAYYGKFEDVIRVSALNIICGGEFEYFVNETENDFNLKNKVY